jgi:hypothetical protein
MTETAAGTEWTGTIPPAYCSRCGKEIIGGSYASYSDGRILCFVCMNAESATFPEPTFGPVGWKCPVCGRGNAPWLLQCDCVKDAPK